MQKNNQDCGYIIIPYSEYLQLAEARKHIREDESSTPPAVVFAIENGCTPLKAWRAYKNMTQAELSETAHVQRTVITRIEHRKNKPRWSTLKKLADAMVIDPDQLDIAYYDFLKGH